MEQETPQANPWVMGEGATTEEVTSEPPPPEITGKRERGSAWGPFVRDVAIVCGIVIVTSVITDVVMTAQGYVAPFYLMSIPTKLAFIVAGAIVGCLTRSQRFHNLLKVGLACWGIGFLLIPVFGLTLWGWGIQLLFVLAMLALGGIVSLMMVGEEGNRGLRRY